MGVVYRAIDPNIGRTVALKTTRLDVDPRERNDLVLRFRNEAHAAGQMNHPNIVTIHDADESEGLFYIAMEYLEGETLQSRMAEKGFASTHRIVELARQVAAGLDYAHAMKVVHRDIKPANIMMTRQGVAKIMDFGISKSVGTLTRTGQIFGTPYYMSPEQVMGHAVDGRSDLFSFGVVLYEIATGARPFGGDTVATVVYKIIHETPPAACELETAVHPGLSEVIARCLEKKPDARYQTGAELAADVEKIASSQGDEPSRPVLPSHGAGIRTQPIEITQPVVKTKSAPVNQPAGGTAAPVRGSVTKTPAVRISCAALLVIAAVAFFTTRHHQGSHASAGGYSVTVNVPAKLAHRARREVVERRELQKVRESDRPAPSVESSIPEKVQTRPLQRTVAVYFTSRPQGASIRLDGESNPEWVTPYTIADIIPGMHRVEITKDGYSPEIRDVEIGPTDAPYGVDLVPK